MDPFRYEALREQRTKILGLLLLGLLVAALACLFPLRSPGQKQLMIGQIVRFGSYANDLGDHPLVLVRVADGSTHQMVIRRDQASRCKVGDRIAIYPVGKTYRVSVQGCAVDQSPKP